MKNEELYKSFQHTQHLIDEIPILKQQSNYSVKNTVVYDEECSPTFLLPNKSWDAEVIVEENTTFAAAQKYLNFGKVGVLVFANPHVPGGGVLEGAMGQEECLCRSSSLYPCFESQRVQRDFYEYHRKKCGKLFSDKVIYSPKVTVFKTDDRVPQLMRQEDWFCVDVLTCAAPYVKNLRAVDEEKLLDIFERRITNIFDVARDNFIEVLILGAFGCGAFGNPPEIVAKAFHNVSGRYLEYFEKIVFAIGSSAKGKSDKVNKNLDAFRNEIGCGHIENGPPFVVIMPEVRRPFDSDITKDYWIQESMYIHNEYEVYKGIHKETNKICVIKKYSKKNRVFFEAMKESAIKSEKMTIDLSHPSISKIEEIIENDEYLFLIREYVEGQTLDKIIKENGPLSQELVIELARQLAEVLNYLHSQNPAYIHRDIKPMNVVLTNDNKIKLIDFEIMRRYDPKKTCDTQIIGTKGYAAPEQYGARQTDGRTDIYALGIMLNYLLTGNDPLNPDYECKPICQTNPVLSKGLEKIICKCTALNPEKRYQNCNELIEAIDRLEKPKGFWRNLFS